MEQWSYKSRSSRSRVCMKTPRGRGVGVYVHEVRLKPKSANNVKGRHLGLFPPVYSHRVTTSEDD